MEKFSRYTLALAWVVFTAGGLRAQPKPPVPQVNVELKAVAFGRGITNLGALQQGKKKMLYVPSYALSEPYTYQGPEEMDFLQSQVIDGVKKEVSVTRVKIPLDMRKGLVIFVPSAKEPGKFGSLVVPHSETDAPANTARFINYTGRMVPIALNNAQSLFENGKMVTVPLVKGRVKVFIPRVKKQADDQADICRETYTAPEGGRLTLLIIPPLGGGFADNEEALTIVPLADAPPPPVPGAPKPPAP